MYLLALAVFMSIVSPGPGVMTLAGVGASFGFRRGIRYFLGLFIGTNLVALAVITGVTGAILAAPVLRYVLMGLSIAYLFYLALKIAFAGSKIGFIDAEVEPGIWAGISLQAINPKSYIVNTAFFTGYNFYPESYGVELLLKFIIVNVIWVVLHLMWLAIGASVQQMNLSPFAQSVINKIMAALMIGFVVLTALSV